MRSACVAAAYGVEVADVLLRFCRHLSEARPAFAPDQVLPACIENFPWHQPTCRTPLLLLCPSSFGSTLSSGAHALCWQVLEPVL